LRSIRGRIFVILLAAPFLLAIARVLPAHPYVIAVATVEMLSVFLIIIRRPGAITMTPFACFSFDHGTKLFRPKFTSLSGATKCVAR